MARGGLSRSGGSGAIDDPPSGAALLSGAIWALPIPTAPPSRSSRAGLGLHLMQSALRLEHVDRVSERLTLVDATHMARHVDIDVSVDKLPDGKEAALTVGGAPTGAAEPMLWVPVGRHPRESLGPVVLRDADQRSLIRVSSRETNRLLAAAAIQLLRLLVNSEDSADVQHLRGPNRAARWLVEAAILALVEDGRRAWPQHPAVTDEAVRRQARDSLAALLPADDVAVPGAAVAEHAFYRLLATLTTEQIIIAMIPTVTRQLRISYDAPELGARHTTRGSRLWLRSRDFTARYATSIPADLDSFHVTVVVPEEMEVRHFLMVSDADSNAAAVLQADIRNLVARLRPPTELATRSALLARFEAQGIESRLAELSRRRAEDLDDYVRYLTRLHARLGQRRPVFPRTPDAVLSVRRLLHVTRGGRRLVSALQRLPRGAAGGPDLQADWQQPDTLTALGERLRLADLGKDLHLDNDPRESAGHIQWRRHATGLGLPSDQEVRASVFVCLGDSSPSAAIQVLGFTALNLLLVVGLIAGTEYTDSTGQSEVLVTLLLLIPGILLSRFDLAPRRSVLSRIRRWPRRIAWASVIVNSVLALWVVVSPTSSVPAALSLPAGLAVGALAVLVVVSAVHVLLGSATVASLAPPYVGVPAWLRNEVRVTPLTAVAPPSVTFAERSGDLDV